MSSAYWKLTNENGEVVAEYYHPVDAINAIKDSRTPRGLLVNDELEIDAVNLSFALFRKEQEDLLWDTIADYVSMTTRGLEQ